jgi:hypothetical protein
LVTLSQIGKILKKDKTIGDFVSGFVAKNQKPGSFLIIDCADFGGAGCGEIIGEKLFLEQFVF